MMTEEIDWAKVALDLSQHRYPAPGAGAPPWREPQRDPAARETRSVGPTASCRYSADRCQVTSGNRKVTSGNWKVTSGNTFAYRDLARTPPPALVGARPSI